MFDTLDECKYFQVKYGGRVRSIQQKGEIHGQAKESALTQDIEGDGHGLSHPHPRHAAFEHPWSVSQERVDLRHDDAWSAGGRLRPEALPDRPQRRILTP